MIEKMSDLLPKPVSEFIPKALDDAIDKIDIAPDSLKSPDAWEKYWDALPSVVAIILCAMFLLWAGRWINRGITALKTRRLKDPEAIKRANTVSSVMGYAYSVVVYLSAILLVFEKMGIAIAPLLGAAGIFGIAIGFGAQSLVKDYFTGLFLLLENQLRRGDIVEVGGKSGIVEEVTLRYVCLRDYAGLVHFVPNNMISTVTNHSWGFGFAVMDVGVAYHENLDRCIEVMKRVGAELRLDPEYSVKIVDDLEIAGVNELAASSIILRSRIKVVASERSIVRREFLKRLKIAFDRDGIEIPFPHMMIQTSAPKQQATFHRDISPSECAVTEKIPNQRDSDADFKASPTEECTPILLDRTPISKPVSNVTAVPPLPAPLAAEIEKKEREKRLPSS